ncbi:MAG: phosphatase PAP2 family protein [Acidimicrobiales bacterium]
MWLAWEIAIGLAVVLALVGLGLRTVDHPRARALMPFAFEASVLFALYTLWRFAGRLSIMETDQAIERGRRLWEIQQTMRLPDEADLQAMILPYSWVVQFANIYYALAHVPAMIICLFWLFWRHRAYYPPIRNALAASTAACLVIQLWPVAPPRFVEDLGIIDTPELYDQSVYSALGYQVAGQLQAMPSIHVAWAVLVAVATWRAGGSLARFLGMSHVVLTMWVVMVTGNHFWLDGIVAALLVWLALAVDTRLRTRFRRHQTEVAWEPPVLAMVGANSHNDSFVQSATQGSADGRPGAPRDRRADRHVDQRQP